MPVEPAKPPARRADPKPTAAAARTAAREQSAKLVNARFEAVNGIFQVCVLGLTARGMYADAGTVSIHGPRVSRELALLAESDQRIASVVDYLTSAGPYTGLAFAVLPLVLQLAANHGRLDASKTMMPGIIDPKELETQVRDDINKKKTVAQEAAARSIWENQ